MSWSQGCHNFQDENGIQHHVIQLLAQETNAWPPSMFDLQNTCPVLTLVFDTTQASDLFKLLWSVQTSLIPNSSDPKLLWFRTLLIPKLLWFRTPNLFSECNLTKKSLIQERHSHASWSSLTMFFYEQRVILRVRRLLRVSTDLHAYSRRRCFSHSMCGLQCQITFKHFHVRSMDPRRSLWVLFLLKTVSSKTVMLKRLTWEAMTLNLFLRHLTLFSLRVKEELKCGRKWLCGSEMSIQCLHFTLNLKGDSSRRWNDRRN